MKILLTMGVGRELKRIRIANGKVSVIKLAAAIGVDPERWRKWESKDLNPKMEDEIKIEKFFGVPISDLQKVDKITKSLKPNPVTSDEGPILNHKLKTAYVKNFARIY